MKSASLILVVAALALAACSTAKPLSQADARATWETESRDLGYDAMKFAPVWQEHPTP